MDKDLQIRTCEPSVNVASRLENFLIAFILLYAGIRFTLPVPFNGEIIELYPWWAKTISLGNVLFYEWLFILWLALFGGKYVFRVLLLGASPARQSAVSLILFATWTGLVSLSTPLPLQDFGRTLRLLLNGALILAAVRWARQGGLYPMIWLVSGFLIGTIINLFMSFQFPLIVGGIMRLAGQNTPGVAMGIAIHLSAWVYLLTTRLWCKGLMVVASLACMFGSAISNSRTGLIAAIFGVIVWCYVIATVDLKDPKLKTAQRKTRRYLIPVVSLSLVFIFLLLDTHHLVNWMSSLWEQKFRSDSQTSPGDSYRWAYAIGTLEILTKTPWGVGYSGFYDAMINTEIYLSGVASPEIGYEANPHASFLYFASAGGLPGLLLGCVTVLLLLNSMWVGLRRKVGRPGVTLFWLIVIPYVAIGISVPYLLNSIILIAPAAIAAGWGWAQKDKSYCP